MLVRVCSGLLRALQQVTSNPLLHGHRPIVHHRPLLRSRVLETSHVRLEHVSADGLALRDGVVLAPPTVDLRQWR